MARNALFIDYEYCSGCRSCLMACQVEKGLEPGKSGMEVFQIGPYRYDNDTKWEFTFMAVPTDLCDLCADRVAAGKKPSCAQACQAAVIKYGTVDELAADVNAKGRTAIYAPVL